MQLCRTQRKVAHLFQCKNKVPNKWVGPICNLNLHSEIQVTEIPRLPDEKRHTGRTKRVLWSWKQTENNLPIFENVFSTVELNWQSREWLRTWVLCISICFAGEKNLTTSKGVSLLWTANQVKELFANAAQVLKILVPTQCSLQLKLSDNNKAMKLQATNYWGIYCLPSLSIGHQWKWNKIT